MGSRIQRHTIAHELRSILTSMIPSKLQYGHPNGGAKYRWGGLK